MMHLQTFNYDMKVSMVQLLLSHTVLSLGSKSWIVSEMT